MDKKALVDKQLSEKTEFIDINEYFERDFNAARTTKFLFATIPKVKTQ